MAFSFECFAITHIGSCRKNHEDNFFIGSFLTLEEQNSLSQTAVKSIQKHLVVDSSTNRIFAVSDGMGGHRHGEVASSMVTEALSMFSGMHQERAARRHQEKYAYIQAFQEMIHGTNQSMLSCSENENEISRMGATLSGAVVFADELAVFNIGDSAVFLFENGTLHKLTKDDNEAQRLGQSERTVGNIYGKRLTKYVGMERSHGRLTATFSRPIPLRRGQLVVIATDGLTDSLSQAQMRRVLALWKDSPELAAVKLTEEALGQADGGHDNITVVVVKIQKSIR
ncbi:MAG: serine/threonine-protein phosphatase [Lachnospiraceae bacterium]|nr:serine/threonine-protein phosphatase [Lachnospiraceae bacterium]